jgi:hypothetical protein
LGKGLFLTKIYTYCLFDHEDTFHGVYSSLKAVHRDALKICNRGRAPIVMEHAGGYDAPTLTVLRNVLKGEIDVQIQYRSGSRAAKIIKTKLKE